MAIHARIGYMKDKKIKATYVYWDGQIQSLGKILYNNYNTDETVENLISFGSASRIRENIGEKIDYNADRDNEEYHKQHADQCVFYCRDRGDSSPNIWDYEKKELATSQEYNYLFAYGTWYVACKANSHKFTPLSMYLDTTPPTTKYP